MNNEPKRGRPPKTNPSSKTLPPIRVTADQKERYRKAAEKKGMSVSAWIKSLADKEVEVNGSTN